MFIQAWAFIQAGHLIKPIRYITEWHTVSMWTRHGAKYFSKYLNTFRVLYKFKSTVRVRVQVSVAVMSMSTSTSIEYLSTFKSFQANAIN